MYKKYKKDSLYSYTLGAFPTFELINGSRSKEIEKILISKKYQNSESLIKILEDKKIKYEFNDKNISLLSDKGNVYVVGIFQKYLMKIEDKNHLVLVNPSDMGNLGTMIRTALGFGIKNIAVIGDSCDIFNPKVIRASMGAFYKVNIEKFTDFEEYDMMFKNREKYAFMLDGEHFLKDVKTSGKFSIIFGNEGFGLDESFKKKAISIKINQTEDIDSLNITIAGAIGLYEFTKGDLYD